MINAGQLELACPYCAGRFQVQAAAESHATACPHCGRSVTVPGGPPQAIRPSPPELQVSAPNSTARRAPFEFAEPPKVLVNRRGEPVPLRRLSPDERNRHRRRTNIAFALAGMVILALALALLLRLRP